MRLLIDLSAVQSVPATDPLGRSLLALTDALLPEAAAAGHEVHLLLSTAGAGTVPGLQRRFAQLHAARRLHVFGGMERAVPGDLNGAWRGAAHQHLQGMARAVLAADVVLDHESTPAALGAAPAFYSISEKVTEMDAMRARLDLTRAYLLCPLAGVSTQEAQALIRAYAGLPIRQRQVYDLILACPEGDSAPLHASIRDHLPADGNARILEDVAQADWPALLAAARLCVCAGESPPAPLLLQEANACGTPVLQGADTARLQTALAQPVPLNPPTLTPFDWTAAAQDTLSLLARHAEALTRPDGWAAVQAHLDQVQGVAEQAIAALPGPPRARDIEDATQALLQTRLMAEDAWRPRILPEGALHWRMEGQMIGSYSLAVINRENARALGRRGVEMSLVNADGPGLIPVDEAGRATVPDLLDALDRGAATGEPPDILSRLMFPPRSDDMQGPVNLAYGYAWEETAFPQAYVRDFNRHLQGVLVCSPHVKKVLEDEGVGIPITVVGYGIEQVDVAPEPLPVTLQKAAFTLLHVSSCFPRKGVDVLLESYAQAFASETDVVLVIKTHPNPHNDLEDQIAALRARHPGTPPIQVIFDDLNGGQMRSLLAAADLMVLPSRAEGYCIPVAEAVLAGTPVLTTGWSGQTIFKGNPMVSWIDYDFAQAESHLDTWTSAWAEPKVADLTDKLQAARHSPAPDAETRAEGAAQIRRYHTWDRVAERGLAALPAMLSNAPAPPPRVTWISTFNTRCGIATYSAHLLAQFPDADVRVMAAEATDRTGPDKPNVTRCWHSEGRDDLSRLAAALEAEAPDVVVIQFNYAFYDPARLGALISAQKAAGRRVVMMMHATDDRSVEQARRLARLQGALAQCDRLLVHGVQDLNRLKDMGLVENVALFPHGVPYADVAPAPPLTPERPVVLGAYGFFLPQKGFDRLIGAVADLRAAGENVALHLITAEYPADVSRHLIREAQHQIATLRLTEHVQLVPDFLPDADSFTRLGAADLLVFPYGPTAESASGAVRQALALDRPVVVSPSPIFDDVEDVVLRLPGYAREDLVTGLGDLVRTLRAGDPEGRLAARQSAAARWRAEHVYRSLSGRLWRQICALDTAAPDAWLRHGDFWPKRPH